MKTIYVKPSELERKWYLVDAAGQRMGRIASQVASILRGKNKPYYSPHLECGDYVIIINAEKAVMTGRKGEDKIYYRHTGYPGGIRQMTYNKALKRKPTFPMEKAIKGMLPKNRLGRKLFTNVKIYADDKHSHQSQKPEVIEILKTRS
ncbi:MAG: 50S ribosomal protein L13 [Spirochaetales bacterium]|nr:50S ribosomal protein L13 [Spirochaetales bacterium]